MKGHDTSESAALVGGGAVVEAGSLGSGARAKLWALCVWALVMVVFSVTVMLSVSLPFAGHTGARRVTWYGVDGAALSSGEAASVSWRGCRPADMGLSSLVFDGGVWTPCRHPEVPQGGWARLDPGEGVGRFAWPAPASLKVAGTVGLLPGPDGMLGVVYWANETNGKLAVGIMGRQGWVRAPELMPGELFSEFLGGAWVEGHLEVAISPTTSEQPLSDRVLPSIIELSLEPGRPQLARQPFTKALPACADTGMPLCGPVAAWHDGAQWQFMLRESALGDTTKSPQVLSAGGELRRSPVEWQGVRARALSWRSEVFLTSVGKLSLPAARVDPKRYSTATLTADRRLIQTPAPPREGWRHVMGWPSFVAEEQTLREAARWHVPGERLTLAHLQGERWWALSSTHGVPGDLLFLQDVTDDEPSLPWAVARAPSFSCGDLSVGVMLPRRDGQGHWLVEPGEGCFVRLDAQFRRDDPLSLREHLRRRGSIGIDWDEPWHLWMLIALWVGAVPCGALGGWWGRRRGGDAALWRGVAWGGAVYLLGAALGWVQLLPLLL